MDIYKYPWIYVCIYVYLYMSMYIHVCPWTKEIKEKRDMLWSVGVADLEEKFVEIDYSMEQDE